MRYLPLLVAGCSAAPAPAPSPAGAPVFVGMCDASGSVELGPDRLIVADDEDNILRVYDTRGGNPLARVDLSMALGLELAGTERYPETDLEAGTIVGDKALWLSSHARGSNGQTRPERLRLFATTIDNAPALHGRVYTRLLEDLLADPRFERFGLRAATERAPKAPGGFNIEGMTATPDGGVIIGLRNPIVDGKSIVVPLVNPLAVVGGEAPVFGDPVLLDLGGRGVRALSWWRGRYLIAAGEATDRRELVPTLYTWDGNTTPVRALAALGTLNPEAFFSPDERDAVLVLSDDGTVTVDGEPCKEQRSESKKSFRGAWISVR